MRNWTKASATATNGNAPATAADGAIPPGHMHNHLWSFGTGQVAKGTTDPDTLHALLIGEHVRRQVPGADYGVSRTNPYSNLHKMAHDLANGRVAQAVAEEAGGEELADFGPEPAPVVVFGNSVAKADAATDPEEAYVEQPTPGLPDFPEEIFRGPACAQFEEIRTHGIPAAFAAGSLLGAAATVLGKSARVQWGGWTQYPGLYIVTVGQPNSGKSPAFQLAFAPVRSIDRVLAELYDDALAEWRATSKGPRDPAYTAAPVMLRLTYDDVTMEALLRGLKDNGETGAIARDELAAYMQSLGQYKQGSNSDYARLLELWTQGPVGAMRVGNTGTPTLHNPVLTVCGTSQFARVFVFGTGEDGGQGRFLMFAANAVPPADDVAGTLPCWQGLLDELFEHRTTERGDQAERVWTMADEALDLFRAKRREWRTRAQELGQGEEGGALGKADSQTMRLAVVLAELEAPGCIRGRISADALDRAAQVVDFSAACWADMPPSNPMALSYKDRELNPRVELMRAWLRGRGRVKERDLKRAYAAGARKAGDQAEMFKAFRETYPANYDPATKKYWA